MGTKDRDWYREKETPHISRESLVIRDRSDYIWNCPVCHMYKLHYHYKDKRFICYECCRVFTYSEAIKLGLKI
jgi:transposase-like protein